MNKVIDIIKNRTSLRKYADREISKEYKDLLFEMAMQAPTAGNQMLYSMIDITDGGIKKNLSISCDNQSFIADAPMVIVFVADQQKWFDYYDACGVREFCYKHKELVFEAPQESDLIIACEDAMCAAQNMVIAAESLGIGSCYIGDILENHEHICRLLDLPEWTFPISMLVLGYYPDDHKKVFRKRFDKQFVVFENQYHKMSEEELAVMFLDTQKKYNSKEQYGIDNFAIKFYARKTGAEFSKEMARSVRVALKKWDGRKL